MTHEVETTIIGNECSDLLSVLDELDTDTLSDSRVGLLGLNTDLSSQHDVPIVHFMSSIVHPVSSILAKVANSFLPQISHSPLLLIRTFSLNRIPLTFSRTIPLACEVPPVGEVL